MENPNRGSEKDLIITVSARALFDFEEDNKIFEEQGKEAYMKHQIENEANPLAPGPALNMVQKLLKVNEMTPDSGPKVDVVLLSRNSADTALRIFNSMEHYNLGIMRAVLTGGAPSSTYIKPLGTKLFLSSNPEQVSLALQEGVAAATLPVMPDGMAPPSSSDEIRIAFDGDAVIFCDESDVIYKNKGLEFFNKYEKDNAERKLGTGPFRGFLTSLHELQCVLGDSCPIRTALVTARGLPSHYRALLTMREWGVRTDESMFLAGSKKGPFLKSFGADLFFDDSTMNIENALENMIPSGHVPSGSKNSLEHNKEGIEEAEQKRKKRRKKRVSRS